MKNIWATMALLASAGVAYAAAPPPSMQVSVQGVAGMNAPLPPEYARCVPDYSKHTKPGANMSPFIAWQGAPQGTKSYAVIMHDSSVPVDRSMANKEDKTIPATAPRQDLHHWVLVDVPMQLTQIGRGQEMYKGGQLSDKASYGMRGRNDMGNRGYDGACPPWNDESYHLYHFTVYALDVENLGLSGEFTAAEALLRIKQHVIAQGEMVARYSQNPDIKEQVPAE